MIIRWMTDGELEDEHSEFFVVKTSSENYWRDSHELRLQYIYMPIELFKYFSPCNITSIIIIDIGFDIVGRTSWNF